MVRTGSRMRFIGYINQWVIEREEKVKKRNDDDDDNDNLIASSQDMKP
jgi:hypothetical protein